MGLDMTPELQELHEHAEHGAHNPSMAPVSLSMAILSVAVAVVTLMGVRSHTEEVTLQGEANDEWAYYQAKDVRLHEDKVFADLSTWVAVSDPDKAAKAREASLAEIEKYRKQEEDLQAEATRLNKETKLESRRGDRYDFGEIFLEVALVVTSITLLSGRRMFWHAGIVLGIVGVVVASTALLVR
jgi:Domain of unknown function (DUF4337)